MHKRAPILRPRKGNNSSSRSPSTRLGTAFKSQSFTKQEGRIKESKGKNALVWIVIMLCIFGFLTHNGLQRDHNQNKELSSSTNSENINKALVDDKKKVVSTSILKSPGDDQDEKKDALDDDHDGKDYTANYHLIFSTDCSAFQHWQSYLMFYSALRVNQPGTITRIASGCSDDEAKEATKWHEDHVTKVMGDRFKLHLTPHFSGVKDADGNIVGDYKFFNKPFGLLHWLENGIGFEEGSTEVLKNLDDVVILIDPDMILLRPITGDFSNDENVIIGKIHQRERKYYVKHGSPFAQKYGFGSQWRSFDLDTIAGPTSPAKEVSAEDGNAFYPVGPPYLATVKDMYPIAQKWSEFVPKVHKQYPHLLAEMFAFCIAAAHLGLKHQIVASLMISNVSSGRDEGWEFVDNITENKESSLCRFSSQSDHSKHPVPSVIHYCQRYAIGEWFFGKRKMVKNFFECESPLMEFPPLEIVETTNYKKIYNDVRKELTKTDARRNGFMTCGILGALNDASKFFKENSCKGMKVNMELTTNLNK